MKHASFGELSSHDLLHLERTRSLARKGWGMVHPNPMVGCVLVRDGEVVAEGYHSEFGGPHAEIAALEAARSRAEGATAYVSLEPCNHHGKTPPCSEALIQAGVRRVVYGAADPSEAAGGGAHLQSAGVDVVGPVWSEEEAREQNPVFFHAQTSGQERPFVALKLAMSLDGYIAASPGDTTRISGTDAHHAVHHLRRGFDGILVGATTLRVDDPRLTVRLAPPGVRPPRRLVLDGAATLPDDAALFDDADGAPVHVFTRRDVSEAQLERLEDAGAHVHPVPGTPDGLDLKAVLKLCWDMGLRSVLCEGGGRVGASLLRQGLVEQLHLLIAPKALGGGVPAFPPDLGPLSLDAFRPVGSPRYLGRDTHIVFNKRQNV